MAAGDRRTAAIYLWGYCAEMVLKAAYFSLTGPPVGFSDVMPITWAGHIQPAINRGRLVHLIAWLPQGAGHNVRAWAELLVAERALSPATVYPTEVGLQVQRCGQRIGELWRETLRYHKNRAYSHELSRVREAAEWLLIHSHNL